MKYEVYDLVTRKRITDDYNFVLKPDGRIAYNDYGDEIGLENVTAIFFPADNEHLYIDDIGGVHDSGCGCDPNGRDCGECSFITCSHCGVWDKRKEEQYGMSNEICSEQL